MNVKRKDNKEKKTKSLEEKLKDCEKLKQEYLVGWQKERADFLNYKKEEAERMGELLKYAVESLILEMLPILDSIEKAKKEFPESLKDNNYLKGLLQINKQLEDFLKTQGIERIETLGKKFDPHFHEAVEEIETKDKGSGVIIEEVRAGYMFKDRLLRPVKVKISK